MATLAPSSACTVSLSAATHKDLRELLADGGAVGQEAIEQFVDEAVRSRIFDTTVRQIKAANVGVTEQEMMSTIDEALEWARAQK